MKAIQAVSVITHHNGKLTEQTRYINKDGQLDKKDNAMTFKTEEEAQNFIDSHKNLQDNIAFVRFKAYDLMIVDCKIVPVRIEQQIVVED